MFLHLVVSDLLNNKDFSFANKQFTSKFFHCFQINCWFTAPTDTSANGLVKQDLNRRPEQLVQESMYLHYMMFCSVPSPGLNVSIISTIWSCSNNKVVVWTLTSPLGVKAEQDFWFEFYCLCLALENKQQKGVMGFPMVFQTNRTEKQH